MLLHDAAACATSSSAILIGNSQFTHVFTPSNHFKPRMALPHNFGDIFDFGTKSARFHKLFALCPHRMIPRFSPQSQAHLSFDEGFQLGCFPACEDDSTLAPEKLA
jgi:hypothetical protein